MFLSRSVGRIGGSTALPHPLRYDPHRSTIQSNSPKKCNRNRKRNFFPLSDSTRSFGHESRRNACESGVRSLRRVNHEMATEILPSRPAAPFEMEEDDNFFAAHDLDEAERQAQQPSGDEDDLYGSPSTAVPFVASWKENALPAGSAVEALEELVTRRPGVKEGKQKMLVQEEEIASGEEDYGEDFGEQRRLHCTAARLAHLNDRRSHAETRYPDARSPNGLHDTLLQSFFRQHQPPTRIRHRCTHHRDDFRRSTCCIPSSQASRRISRQCCRNRSSLCSSVSTISDLFAPAHSEKTPKDSPS